MQQKEVFVIYGSKAEGPVNLEKDAIIHVLNPPTAEQTEGEVTQQHQAENPWDRLQAFIEQALRELWPEWPPKPLSQEEADIYAAK